MVLKSRAEKQAGPPGARRRAAMDSVVDTVMFKKLLCTDTPPGYKRSISTGNLVS